MARKALSRMGLDSAVVRLMAARKLHTAKDALGLTEMELLELLDMPLPPFTAAFARINDSVCPPCRTVLSILKERTEKEGGMGHLSTGLNLLDEALCGGVPFGVITELVGPPGIGKTQLCLVLSIQAAIPLEFGGLEGSVVYIDTERKFSARRLLQIGRSKYPELFSESKVEEIAKRIIILTPASATEFVESLQKLQVMIIERGVKLVIIDSMATLLEGVNEDELIDKQDFLGKQATLMKYLAESLRIPFVVTNHVRSSGLFEGDNAREASGAESELVAALGTAWAHAVNIRLVLEVREGRRFIRIAKSPMSAAIAIPYFVTHDGIQVDGNEAFQVNEQDVMAIYRNYDDLEADEEIIRLNFYN